LVLPIGSEGHTASFRNPYSEDLNSLYGAISWDQIYHVIVVWELELMEDKYMQMRQHMKFNLPGLLETP
jgi:hypothetical protein